MLEGSNKFGIIALVFFLPVYVFASEIDLGEVLVSMRYTLRQQDLVEPSEYVVFDNGLNIEDLVYNSLSLDVLPGKGEGGQVLLGYQGLYPRQTAVVVNGVAMESLSSGMFDIGKLPLAFVDRMELVGSGPSVLWGKGLGGVVGLEVSVRNVVGYSWDSMGRRQVFFGVDGIGDIFGVGVDIGQTYSDRIAKKRAWKKVVLEFSFYDYSLLTVISSADIGSGRFPDGSYQKNSYDFGFVRIQKLVETIAGDFQWMLGFVQDKSVTKSFSEESILLSSSKDLSRRLVLSGDFSLWTDEISFLTGMDVQYGYLKATQISDTKDKVDVGMYFQLRRFWDSFSVGLGARIDWDRDYSWNGSYEVMAERRDILNWEWISWENMRFLFAITVSPPPLMWQYYDRGMVVGNHKLKPESADTLSIESTISVWEIKNILRWSLSYIDDGFHLARREDGLYEMRNIDSYYRLSLKWDIERNLWEDIDVRLSFWWGRSWNRILDKEIEGVPKFKASATISWKILCDVSLWSRVYLQDWFCPQSYYSKDNRLMMDLGISGSYKKFNWRLAVRNVFDEEFWIDYYYPEDGRRWEAVLGFRW